MEPVAPVSPATTRKASNGGDPSAGKEKKYRCQFCSRAFSRSEHRSRHERSRKLYRTTVNCRGFFNPSSPPSQLPHYPSRLEQE